MLGDVTTWELSAQNRPLKSTVCAFLLSFGAVMLATSNLQVYKKPYMLRQVIAWHSRTPLLHRMASTLPRLPIFESIASHDPQSSAVIHSTSGRRFTYGELLDDVADAKEKLQASACGRATDGERIAFLAENSYDYVGAITVMSMVTTETSNNTSNITVNTWK